MTKQETPKSIGEYIAGYPPEVQEILESLRSTIRQAAPDAVEAIRYEIPTFIQNGGLVSFAAWKNHIALYPAPTGSAKFNKQLAAFKTEKSTVRFPLDKPIPLGLVTQIVKLRAKDNAKRAKERAKRKRK